MPHNLDHCYCQSAGIDQGPSRLTALTAQVCVSPELQRQQQQIPTHSRPESPNRRSTRARDRLHGAMTSGSISVAATACAVLDCLDAACTGGASSADRLGDHFRAHGAHRHHDTVFRPLKIRVVRGGRIASAMPRKSPTSRSHGSDLQRSTGSLRPSSTSSGLGSMTSGRSGLDSASSTRSRGAPATPVLLFNSYAALSHARSAMCYSHLVAPPPPGRRTAGARLVATAPAVEMAPLRDPVTKAMVLGTPVHFQYLHRRRRWEPQLPPVEHTDAPPAQEAPVHVETKVVPEPEIEVDLALPDIPSTRRTSKPKPTAVPAVPAGPVEPIYHPVRRQSLMSKPKITATAADESDDDEEEDDEDDQGETTEPSPPDAEPAPPPPEEEDDVDDVSDDLFPLLPSRLSLASSMAGSDLASRKSSGTPRLPIHGLLAHPIRLVDPRVLDMLDGEREALVSGLLELHTKLEQGIDALDPAYDALDVGTADPQLKSRVGTSIDDDETLFQFMSDFLLLLMVQRERLTGVRSVQYAAQLEEVQANPADAIRHQAWTLYKYLHLVQRPLIPGKVMAQLLELGAEFSACLEGDMRPHHHGGGSEHHGVGGEEDVSVTQHRLFRRRLRMILRRHFKRCSTLAVGQFKAVLGHLSRFAHVAEMIHDAPETDPDDTYAAAVAMLTRLPVLFLPLLVQPGWMDLVPTSLKVMQLPMSITTKHMPASLRPTTARSMDENAHSMASTPGLTPGSAAFWHRHLQRDPRLRAQSTTDAVPFLHALIKGLGPPNRADRSLMDLTSRRPGTGYAEPAAAHAPLLGPGWAMDHTPDASASTLALAIAANNTVLPSPPAGTPCTLSPAASIAALPTVSDDGGTWSPASPDTTRPVSAYPVLNDRRAAAHAGIRSAGAPPAARSAITVTSVSRARTSSFAQRVLVRHGSASGPSSAQPRPHTAGTDLPPLPITTTTVASRRTSRAPPSADRSGTPSAPSTRDGSALHTRVVATIPADLVARAAALIAYLITHSDLLLDAAAVRALRLDRDLRRAEADPAASAPAGASAPMSAGPLADPPATAPSRRGGGGGARRGSVMVAAAAAVTATAVRARANKDRLVPPKVGNGNGGPTTAPSPGVFADRHEAADPFPLMASALHQGRRTAGS
ncbi:hypothetical protein AMAG_13482 [Allomyces macrogynus ATCC 38327]|uniref:Uncharacterized protein n=1 Tax=Allomyces macrogynus (strain ATCC 38327) TaxID=578462 RepID=A0A0L0T1W6_ALLM3|nr:hypothetical protein AMAG_13482 [Allomyces macrogynus ATCC 38327]|eukprot:KNE68843.1 hypothetical protein AMAG_13482 [Allomyces macrogynus ATCC 38327]